MTKPSAWRGTCAIFPEPKFPGVKYWTSTPYRRENFCYQTQYPTISFTCVRTCSDALVPTASRKSSQLYLLRSALSDSHGCCPHRPRARTILPPSSSSARIASENWPIRYGRTVDCILHSTSGTHKKCPEHVILTNLRTP